MMGCRWSWKESSGARITPPCTQYLYRQCHLGCGVHRSIRMESPDHWWEFRTWEGRLRIQVVRGKPSRKLRLLRWWRGEEAFCGDDDEVGNVLTRVGEYKEWIPPSCIWDCGWTWNECDFLVRLLNHGKCIWHNPLKFTIDHLQKERRILQTSQVNCRYFITFPVILKSGKPSSRFRDLQLHWPTHQILFLQLLLKRLELCWASMYTHCSFIFITERKL